MKNRHETAMMSGYCADCGWPIVFCCCNDEMSNLPYGEFDYWYYCSNVGCKNHEGQGIASCSSEPDFVKHDFIVPIKCICKDHEFNGTYISKEVMEKRRDELLNFIRS